MISEMETVEDSEASAWSCIENAMVESWANGLAEVAERPGSIDSKLEENF